MTAGALIFPAVVYPEAQLPLPELVEEPVVSERVHEQTKREKAELEQRMKVLESELAKQREATAASKDKQRAAEAQMRKAQDELAKLKSGQKKKAEPEKKSDRSEDALKSKRRSFEPEMVFIEGEPFFEMGCVSGKGCQGDETVNPVNVKSFYMGKYEVTFAQWDACVEAKGCTYRPRDQGWGRGDRPVINVSWQDARQYVRWLSAATQKEYHLPSEAQWEYAARAGSRTKYPWGNDIGTNRANCDGCGSAWDDKSTAPVKSFEPYGGLYDMIGNVWEWTCSAYEKAYGKTETECANEEDPRPRVIRGGSWLNIPRLVRSANRFWNSAAKRGLNVGFRVSRTH